MPSRVGSQAATRIRKISTEVQKANRTAVNQAALAAKSALLDSLRNEVPSGRLRNVGRSGAKLGVRYDVRGTSNASALVRATGPWQLVEKPIKPHEIRPRGRGSKRKRALATPWGPRASVDHPGVRNPKKPWAKGQRRAEQQARKVIERTYSSAFRRGATR